MKTVKNTSPDLEGSRGKAWKPNLEAIYAKHPTGARPEVSVGCFVIYAPWAHPAWSYYLLGSYHLRPVANLPPARLHFEGATHEVVVFALHPEQEVPLEDFPQLLTPINIVKHYIAASDEEAREKVDKAVKAILEGNLSPDTDFRSLWDSYF